MTHRCSPPPLRRLSWVLGLCGAIVAVSPSAVRGEADDDYNVAVQFYKQERWDAAARSFRAFLKANSRHAQAPAARLYLGQSLVQQRKFSEARDVFREYVKLHAEAPEIALARFRVAECSYFLQEDRAALKELDDYLQRHAGHELARRARLYRGQTQLRLNDAAGAEQTLSDLVSQKPDQPMLAEAQYALARAAEVQGKTEAAVALFEQLAALKEGPFAADAQFRLATIAFGAEDWGRAAERFAAVARDFPQHRLAATAALNAGYAEYYQRHFAEAIAHFTSAADDPQQAALAGMWIGLTHKEAGDWTQAISAFRSVYEKEPQQPLAEKLLFHWADCELLRGQYAEARRLFVTVADQWPDGERGDDSLHLATGAALGAGDLSDATALLERFEKQYGTSSLRWREQVLGGRIELARGDALRAADPGDPAARQEYARAAERLARVVAESEVPATQLAARLQLARAYDRLGDNEQVITALEAVVAAFRAQPGGADLAEGLLLQAHALNAGGRHADAASVAQLYLDQPGATDAPAAWRELALAKAQLGDGPGTDAALDRLKEADVTGLQAAAAAYECAEAAYAARNWELAAGWFARAAAFDAAAGYKAAALSGLGYARYEAGQHDAAAEAFAELLRLTDGERRLLSNAAHMRGLSLQRAGRTDDAIAAYHAGLQTFAPADGQTVQGDDVEPVLNAYRCGKGAARLLREQGRIEDADAAYAAAYKALTALPTDKQAELDRLINEWALLSYENQRFERSDELFALLVEKCPESELSDDARLYLAESQFFSGKVEEAGAAFQALADDPKADDFVTHRASLLLLDIAADREEWDQLLEYAERFRKRYPQSEQRAYAQYRLGEAALQSDKLERAVAELSALAAEQDEPITTSEWYSSVYVLLAEAQFRAKDYEAVERTVAEFRQRFPASPLLYHADEILGRSYKQRAMLDKAREAFEKVKRSESGRRTQTAAKAQFHIAETFLIEKDYAAALAEYYKVYVNYPFPEWQAPALFQAGQCDESLGNSREATQTYETLVKEFSDSEFAERARQRIEELRKAGR